MGKLNLQTPAMIHFGEETEDEVFISHEAAAAGVEIENTGSEPLVGLRYFGPGRARESAESRRLSQESVAFSGCSHYLISNRQLNRDHNMPNNFSQTSQCRLAGRRRQRARFASRRSIWTRCSI